MSDIGSSSSTPLPTSTSPSIMENGPSIWRKYFLLALFCIAQFLDAFNISALLSAIPVLSAQLKLTSEESVWLISAYQLTFASFLLVSGRISDIYNAKHTFVFGAFWLGIFCLVAGFADNKVALLILRALSGIAAALTIPSSLTLIVRLFPEEREQGRAIGVFGGSAALGNVLGLIVGALFIQFTRWSWVFWLGALIATPISVLCAFLVPTQPSGAKERRKLSNLDPVGISTLTSALILLIFALTSSSTRGWGSAMVLAPLIISISLIATFFVWEAYIPADKAAFPPRTWLYPNFAVLFGLALSIFLWFTTVFLFKVTLWQDIYGWSPLRSAIHFLPIGLLAGPIMLFSGNFTGRFEPKHAILLSLALLIVGTTILPFANSRDAYWSRDFPALAIGSIGGAMLFTNANIAIFHNTPPAIAGTVGAIFNSALQLGSSVGVAIISSVQASVDEKHPNEEYAGRAAGFWFLLGIVGVETIAVTFLYRAKAKSPDAVGEMERKGSEETLRGDVEDAEKRVATSGNITPDPGRLSTVEERELENEVVGMAGMP